MGRRRLKPKSRMARLLVRSLYAFGPTRRLYFLPAQAASSEAETLEAARLYVETGAAPAGTVLDRSNFGLFAGRVDELRRERGEPSEFAKS